MIMIQICSEIENVVNRICALNPKSSKYEYCSRFRVFRRKTFKELGGVTNQ